MKPKLKLNCARTGAKQGIKFIYNIGRCNYSKKCKFAHGKVELIVRDKQDDNNKYRSKLCTPFLNNNVNYYLLINLSGVNMVTDANSSMKIDLQMR